MYGKSLVAACGLAAVANAQLPTPSTTAGIPTVEGALTYQGPPVSGFTGPGGNATVQANNPDATYVARFPTSQFDNSTGSEIAGTVTAVAGPQGTGVTLTFDWSGFPDAASLGPFPYHIHAMPIPADGNCTAAGPHLDPTVRGELHSCEVAAPQTCQAGDLSGKHGNITTPTFQTSYTDNFLSLVPGTQYFIGEKAIVVHTTNATRITCANFVQQLAGSGNGTSAGSNSTGIVLPTPSATGPVATGAASRAAGASMGLLVAAAALFL